jgi:hypothetical protein
MHASPATVEEAPPVEATDQQLVEVYGELDARLVVYAHLHRPFVRRIGSLIVANTGSVGWPVDGDWRPSYLLIDDGEARVRRVRYDLGAQIAELRASSYPSRSWLIKVHQRAESSDPWSWTHPPPRTDRSPSGSGLVATGRWVGLDRAGEGVVAHQPPPLARRGWRLVAVDVDLAEPEAEPLVQAVGGHPRGPRGQVDIAGALPLGQRERRHRQRGGDPLAAGLLVDHDVLDPRPQPGGEREHDQGQHPDDAPFPAGHEQGGPLVADDAAELASTGWRRRPRQLRQQPPAGLDDLVGDPRHGLDLDAHRRTVRHRARNRGRLVRPAR